MTLSKSYCVKLILFLSLTLAGPLNCAGKRALPAEPAEPVTGPATEFKIAILPAVNLSGAPAPVEEIGQALRNRLNQGGLNLINEQQIKTLVDKHRMRYLGGLDSATAAIFRQEAGAAAVLVTTIELYSNSNPPKFSIFSRLIATGEGSKILWINGIGLSGDDSPGLLDLGMITDPRQLQQKAIEYLAESLTAHLAADNARGDCSRTQMKKFGPKKIYQKPFMAPDQKYRVAVIPFYNLSQRAHADDFMALHFAKALLSHNNIEVIEPGVVRQTLLDMRIIMDDGLSLANADLIFHELKADLILNGRVLDYQDYQGPYGSAKVDFAAQIIERQSRRVVWTAKSYNQGDDGVFFFDWGKVNTAHAMARQMVELAVKTIGNK